ncbi:MAG: hypothetical protein ABI601_06445 [bacterium]
MTHRDIAIDVVALLGNARFAEAVRESLSAFSRRCDLLIVPYHHATDALISLAASLYPDLCSIVVKPGWVERLKSELRGKLRILILDDAVVSGRTLRSIHRVIQDQIHLLDEDQRPADGYRISAFAVIGRPHNDSLWKRLGDSLRQTSDSLSLGCYKKLLMPDRSCPWCDEVARLERLQKEIRSAPTLLGTGMALSAEDREILSCIDERLDVLTLPQTGAITGLRNSIFLAGPDGAIRARSPDRLTPHSLFGESLTETTTFAAVASAMHTIRLQMYAHLESSQGVAWEWDVARIVTAFHDPLIQASFLRAARADELRLERTSALVDAAGEALYVHSDPERRVSLMLAAEHVWAAVAQKYPPLIRPIFLAAADKVLTDHEGRQTDKTKRLLQYMRGLEAHLTLPIGN